MHKKDPPMTTIRMKNCVSLFAPVILVVAIFLSGCAKQKAKTDMSFDELKNSVGSLLKKQNYQAASEMLEEVIAKHPERPDIHKFKIILADVYFKLEQYQSACQMYQNYWQQYPSHGRSEYTKYQAVLSKFYQTLKIDCDQTVTDETITLCKEYTANSQYKKYLQDVLDIQNTCEHKLINKEIYVFNFYLGQEQFDAAKSRLNYLKATFLPKQPALEARLCYLECKLAKMLNDEQTMQNTFTLLAQRHPTSPFTRMTEDLFKKPGFLF